MKRQSVDFLIKSEDECDMKFFIIEDESRFEGLREQWNGLLLKSDIKSVFLRWEWMFKWWENYKPKLTDGRLFIIVGQSNGDLKLIFPAYLDREKNGRLTVLYFLGSRFESSDYLSIITCPQKSAELIGLMIEFVTQIRPDVDIWRLLNVLDNDSVMAAFQSHMQKTGRKVLRRHHQICPFISLHGGWDEYVKKLSKNMRYNMQRRIRKLFDEFNAEFDWFKKPDEIESAVESLFNLHEKRWETREENTRFQAGLRMQFHKDVSKLFMEADILRLFRIRVGEEIAAMLYCFQYQGEMMYFQAGFDPKWEKQSVGLVLMAKTIEYSFNHNLRLFDFMRGNEDYKYKWTSTVRKMDLLEVGITDKGKFSLQTENTIRGIKDFIKTLIPEQAWNKLRNIVTDH